MKESWHLISAQHPFHFGDFNNHGWTREARTTAARTAEELSYTTFLILNHLIPDFAGDQFAPIPALLAAANILR